MRVAILDDSGLLIGSKDKKKMVKDDVECGDLPSDGRYRYRNGQFIPVGHGKGKPGTPPVSPYRAMCLMIQALEKGADLPQECLDWAQWYETFGGGSDGTI